MTWENLDKSRPGIAHYSVMKLQVPDTGMAALRGMFPEAVANELNFVLFSTSGVHGTYTTIKEAEQRLKGEISEGFSEVTYLIVHPRLVALRYAVCQPETQDDIEFLKRICESSRKAAMTYFETPNVMDSTKPIAWIDDYGVIRRHCADSTCSALYTADQLRQAKVEVLREAAAMLDETEARTTAAYAVRRMADELEKR